MTPSLRAIRRALVAIAVIASASLAAFVPPTGGAVSESLRTTWARTDLGRFHHSSPTVADLDSDGAPELLIGTLDGTVQVLDARTGAVEATWEVRPGGPAGPRTAVESAPTVADLDNDGTFEVIVGAASTWELDQPGGLVVFNGDGSVRFAFATADEFDVWAPQAPPDGLPDGVFSTPAVGDVDGDGFGDVVFGGWDLRIHALDRFGRPLPGFPFFNDDSVWSSPALHDIDGDGRDEIFIGGDSTAGGPEDWAGGVFRSLEWAGDAVLERWKVRVGEVVHSSPAIGDIDGDGRLEAVVGAGTFYQVPDSHKVYAWHLDDGSPVRGWPRETGDDVFGSPALGDLTGDDGGRPEVVVGSRDGKVWAWRGDGTLVFSVKPNVPGEGGGEIVASPIVADLDGVGAEDVAVGNGFATYLLRGTTGARLAAPVQPEWSHQNAPAVVDLGAGLGWHVIVAGFRAVPGPFAPVAHAGRISALRLLGPATRVSWPEWRRGGLHRGSAASTGLPTPPSGRLATDGYTMVASDGRVYVFGGPRWRGSSAGARLARPVVDAVGTRGGGGYWHVSADGGVFTYGDARFFGSAGGLQLNRPIVGMARTRTGNGYWLVADDGGVFAYGDAVFHGSTGAIALNRPIVGMATTPSGNGYWLVASDGGVFAYGDAVFHGSTGAITLNRPIVAIEPSRRGYLLVASDGGIFAYGDARFHGSTGGLTLRRPVVGIAESPGENGYWLVADDGGVFAYGDARFWGSPASNPLPGRIVTVISGAER